MTPMLSSTIFDFATAQLDEHICLSRWARLAYAFAFAKWQNTRDNLASGRWQRAMITILRLQLHRCYSSISIPATIQSRRCRRRDDNILTFMFSSFNGFCRWFDKNPPKRKTGSFESDRNAKSNKFQMKTVRSPRFADRTKWIYIYFKWFLWDLISRFRFSSGFQSIVSLNKSISVDRNDSITFMICGSTVHGYCDYCTRLAGATRRTQRAAPQATKCFQNKYTHFAYFVCVRFSFVSAIKSRDNTKWKCSCFLLRCAQCMRPVTYFTWQPLHRRTFSVSFIQFVFSTHVRLRSTQHTVLPRTANSKHTIWYNHIKANKRIQNIYTKLFMDFSTVAFFTGNHGPNYATQLLRQ